MEVARNKVGITISQRKYVLDLLQEMRMLGCIPTKASLELNVKLGIEGGKEVEQERYQ